jgi:4-hydroxybenzoate polyprenyltransferase
LGRKNALLVSRILHFSTALLLIGFGYASGMHWIYYTGLIIYAAMLFYQQSIVKENDLSKVDIAFMTANGIASIVFASFSITDLIYFG